MSHNVRCLAVYQYSAINWPWTKTFLARFLVRTLTLDLSYEAIDISTYTKRACTCFVLQRYIKMDFICKPREVKAVLERR